VILNYNGLADTLSCLASLKGQTVSDTQVVVVDNGSSEDPSKIGDSYPEVVLLKRKENGGWAGGNNTGIRYALDNGSQVIILLNNDTVVAANFLERLKAAVDAHSDFRILGALIYSLDHPSEVITEGCQYNRPGYNGFFQSQAVPVQITDPPSVIETDIVNGCCLVAQREVFKDIGLMDERFFLVHEESDFCLRAREKGWKCGIISEPLVWHKKSHTFQRTGNSANLYYNMRNSWLLLRKHAGHPRGTRGQLGSLLQYLRQVHYAYCRALEKGDRAEREAVIDGMTDAWSGRYGPRRLGPNGMMRKFVSLWLSFCAEITRLRGKLDVKHFETVRKN
jgi:GT2 family glycosyltransferase